MLEKMIKRFLIAIGLITALWLLRFGLTDSLYYLFIIGNIVLAAIPLLLEPVFSLVTRRTSGGLRTALLAGVGGVWLLFLPNAFYLLTDFMHLNGNVLVNMRGDSYHYAIPYVRGSALYIFDTFFLLVATLFGAYVGGLALAHAYNWLKRRSSAVLAGSGLAVIMLLTAVGVYIGRFGRWNSWDGLAHPWLIVTDLLSSLAEPVIMQRFSVLVVTFVLYQLACFAYARSHSFQKTLKDRRR